MQEMRNSIIFVEQQQHQNLQIYFKLCKLGFQKFNNNILGVAVREDVVLPPGSLIAHWSMVRGPSLACENQNKPLPRPNDAIMKVVQVSADELLPLSFEACSASDRAPAPHRAWQVHSLAGRVPGGCWCQGKTAKTRRTALWPKRLLLALNVFH